MLRFACATCSGFTVRLAPDYATALVQSLSHPLLWSRAEYTIQKADHLFNQLGVNKTIDHIQRNIESINSVVDHIDELYLADLSEKNNDKATILSIGLAAASLTLTILMLPSFWTDLPLWENLSLTGPYSLPALIFAIMGSLVALGLMSFALYLLFITFRRRKEMQALFKRFINGTPKD